MTSRAGTHLPQAALDWLAPGQRRDILTIGTPSVSTVRGLRAAHHSLTLTDRRLPPLLSIAPETPDSKRIVAQAESLPFAPCRFDIALASQTLHTLAPGLAYAEIARALKPSGYFSIMYLTRDDSVPWVRRLASLLQEADPSAMRGQYGAESVESLADCGYFPVVERRDFRMWVPVSRAGLIAMLQRRSSLQAVSLETMERLVASVGELYDSSARAPEPLLLPWVVQCWRAVVDHSELSKPLIFPDDAVNIRL